MPISSINRIKSIVVPLSVDSSSNIITIYENSGLTIGNELIPGHTIVSFNCFIKNLKAFAEIKSLPEVAMPNFGATDSETEKLYKVLDTEWGSARKQLSLYISNSDNWYKVGSISLLNPSGYPYRIYNLMDIFTDALAIELGDNAKIGIQVEDVGYELLRIGDAVTIHGSYVEEIFVKSPPDIFNFTVTGSTTPVPETPNNDIGNNSEISDINLLGN